MIQAQSMSSFVLLFLLSKTMFAFTAPNLFSRWSKPVVQRYCVHATVLSPFNPYLPPEFLKLDADNRGRGENNDKLFNEDQIDDQREEAGSQLRLLCQELRATPEDLLRLESTQDGVRGIYLNYAIRKGDVILSLPLDSCLADDSPPSWLTQPDGDDEEGSFSSAYNPSDWATRLAAGLVELQLRERSGESIGEGQALWLSMLPDSEYLKASLPVHWPEETVTNARSTSLELAVDSSYFARAETVENLMVALKSKPDLMKGLGDEQLRELCSNALDVVQTRSCRLVEEDSETITLRVLAPIFDFINHGSINVGGEAGANAQFQLENGTHLVVRALRNLEVDQEALIDYGGSARPAWRCLLSYGFVPYYNRIPGPKEEATADTDEEDNVAEVYMDGQRYEVGPSHVPFDMVAAAFESDHPIEDEEGEIGVSLTPEVALKLAERISDVAFYLLLEPERELFDDDPVAAPTPFEVISSREAASLRWSQHRVLLACSLGLREFAAEQTSFR